MRVLKKGAAAAALILALALLLSLAAGAVSFEAFPDGTGHWAEPYLRRAVDEGLLGGDDAGRLSPDSPATMAQALAILCRLLWPGSDRTAEGTDIPTQLWYADYAATARAMDIDFDVSELDASLFSRGRAFVLLAQAFRLIPAEPDYSVLDRFADTADLTDVQRDAAAAMVAAGYLNGDDRGRLNPYAPVSRAELVTMLLRMVEYTLPAAPGELSGGAVLRRASGLSGKCYDHTLWLACDSGDADLRGVTAGTVAVLSRDARIKTDGRTSIDRLIIAGGSGGTLELNPGYVGALVIAPGAPRAVTVRGKVDTVEITCGGHEITVRSSTSRVVISGDGNTVSLVSGSTRELTLTDRSGGNTVSSGLYLEALDVGGRENSVTLSAGCYEAGIGGWGCSVTGRTYIPNITVTSRSAQVKVSGSPNYSGSEDAGALGLDLAVPATFTPGVPLRLTASLVGWESAECTLAWTLDGETVSTETVAVAPGVNEFTCDLPVSLYAGMGSYRLPGVVLTCPDGTSAEKTGVSILTHGDAILSDAVITLTARDHALTAHVAASAAVTNPIPAICTAAWYAEGQLIASAPAAVGPDSVTLTLDTDLPFIPSAGTGTLELRLTLDSSAASAKTAAKFTHITPELALASVTSDYAGDYTLEWALSHDYDPVMKTVWVNAMGYESDTQYLIWVNRTYQRVNVFTGSAGSWTLIKTFLCGTGRAGHATPVSVSKIRTRSERGWVFPTYTVKPVVRFLTGGYAFHSRLWNHAHTELVDDSIGFPVSKGCVRMYDEDIQWIYDTIPEGTTVVVH